MTTRKNTFVLGTVQLGMAYGIRNTTGKPSLEEAFAILDTAFSSGIDTFDTARSYGDVEDIIGKWIRSRGISEKVKVISKMRPKAFEHYAEGTAVADIVCAEVRESLEHLGISRLGGYLLHTADHVYRDDVLHGLRRAKQEGLVEHIGISIYEEPEALEAVHRSLEYVQVPYNAFDQRLDKTDFFDLAEKAGVVTFARSPFLQGLLLMEPDQIPLRLAHARPLVEKFIEIAKRYQLSPIEAALLFSYRSRASHIVFGAETSAQLKGILTIGGRLPSMSTECVEDLRKAFPAVDRAIVNPSLWNRP
ncbi:MAG: oxidoreductase [Parcubacteria group bacterium Gr01-1014_49]|nr:MAG: oxidoreductase [Parcubacteria group bacterium Gr01-1014_49]